MKTIIALLVVLGLAEASFLRRLFGRKPRPSPPPPPPFPSSQYNAPIYDSMLDNSASDLIPNPYNPSNLPPIAIAQNCCKGQPDGPRVIYFPVPSQNNPYIQTQTHMVPGPTVTMTVTNTVVDTVYLPNPTSGGPVYIHGASRMAATNDYE